jgi:putative transposase
MPRKSHPEEKIVYALRQAEAGKKVSDICREMGVSQQAFYSWRRRYAGLGLSDLRELRQLREENRKLKTLVANLTLDKHRCSQKRSEARRSPPTRDPDTARLRVERKPSVRADRDHSLDQSLPKPA